MKIAVLVANGTEEIEALTVVDVVRRADTVCDIVSIGKEKVIGSHGIIITADKTINKVNLPDYDCVVIPGGMPGAKNISENDVAINGISEAIRFEKTVAAICAAPAVVLAEHKLIGNKKVTCFPAKDFIDTIVSARGIYTGKNVEQDGNIITANGPRSAMDFALAVCKSLGITPRI